MGVSAANVPVRTMQWLRHGNMEKIQSLFNGVRNEEQFAALGLEHAFGDTVIKEGEELVIEAPDIQQEDWLCVKFEGMPRENLEEFLQSAESSR
jgi:hypothetical protein